MLRCQAELRTTIQMKKQHVIIISAVVARGHDAFHLPAMCYPCFKRWMAERKEELIPFATAWMELESIMLSEISQAVRDKTI